jgi:predicted dehydrogenase
VQSQRRSTDKISLAIVGSGHGCRVLLPAFDKTAEYKIVALCARTEGNIFREAQGRGITVYPDWEVLIEDDSVEAVALALPPSVQEKIAPVLLDAGKHLFCEKPLSATLVGGQEIRAAALRNKRIVAVDFSFRDVPAFQEFERTITREPFGKVRMVMVEWLGSWRSDSSLTINWKSELSMGGGTYFMVGSHVLDYLSWMFGAVEDINVRAATLVGTREDSDGKSRRVESDDTLLLSGTLHGGIPCVVTLSSAVSVGTGHRIKAFCEHGVLEILNTNEDDSFDNFSIIKDGFAIEGDVRRKQYSKSPGMSHGRASVISGTARRFAKAIREGVPFLPTLEQVMDVQNRLALLPARRPPVSAGGRGWW